MPSVFNRKLSRQGGTSLTAVGAYTVPSATTTVILGLSITNTIANNITASATVNDGVNDYYLVKDAPIAPGATLVIVGGDQKVAVITGDSIKVSSNTATSIDTVMSILENS